MLVSYLQASLGFKYSGATSWAKGLYELPENMQFPVKDAFLQCRLFAL